MSLKKLIATAAVLVGSSTAALAQPYYTNSHTDAVVRDHRSVDWQWMRNHRRVVVRPARAQVNWYASASYNYQPRPEYQPAWQQPSLPSLTLMAASSLPNRFDLDVTNELGNVSKIRLDATGCEGRTYVDKVTIYDNTGRYQQIAVGSYLDAQNPILDLGLTFGAATTRVIVDGQSQLGGKLAVEAL